MPLASAVCMSPRKHQKTSAFLKLSRGYRKRPVAWRSLKQRSFVRIFGQLIQKILSDNLKCTSVLLYFFALDKLKVPGEKRKGFDWRKFVHGLIAKIVGKTNGGDHGSQGNTGNGGDNENSGNTDTGGDNGNSGNTDTGGANGNSGNTENGNAQNKTDGPDKINNGSAQAKELNIKSIIETMQKTSNKSENGTIILKGSTLLSVEFVEQAFENSVLIDTVKRFYSLGMEIFVGQMSGNRIATLQTQGKEGPKLTVKSPTEMIVIKITG